MELRVDLAPVGLSNASRARPGALARRRLDADGRLLVTSQATCSQARNLKDAGGKVAALVRTALALS